MVDCIDSGFKILENFYNKAQIIEIQDAIRDYKNHIKYKTIYESDQKTIRSIMSYHDKNEVLNKYTCDQRMLNIVTKLIGSEVYVSQSKINLKKGIDGKKWDPHRGLTFWHYLDGMPGPNMVSVFICLTEQTIENGAVYVYRGSHKGIGLKELYEESDFIYNDREHDTAVDLSIQIKDNKIKEYVSQFEKVYLTGNPGDVFFLHPCLLHASEDNLTDKSRDLMITVYNSINNLPTKFDRPEYLCEKYKGPLIPFIFK